MPRNKDLKRLVRARMRKTGEAYTAARAHITRKPKANAVSQTAARSALRAMPNSASKPTDYAAVAGMSLLGAGIAFVAGLLALKWLSRWLESGRWYLFGIYCLIAAAAVTALHRAGY